MPATPAQTRAIHEVKSVTGADTKTATKWLKANGWDSSAAINSFYNQISSPTASTASSKATLNKLFEKYAGKNDPMEIGQIMPYFEQIGANPANVSGLVAHEILRCAELGSVTKEGFVEGWSALGCDSIDKQKNLLESRTKTLGQPANREVLKAVYKKAFELSITQAGQRLVNKDEMVELWRIMFTPPALDWRTQSKNWVELWLEFVQGSGHKAFNRDAWTQTFRFAEETLKDETLGWWNEESSWPTVIDEFVEWTREKKGIGKAKADEDEDMEY